MPDNGSVAEAVKGGAGAMTFMGVALVVLGMLAMGAPLVAGKMVALMVGIFALAGGLAQCVFAFQAGSLGRGVLAFALGALTVVCGMLMIAHPLLNLAFLTLLLAAYFVVSGVFEMLYAFRLRPTDGWLWLLVGGLVSLLLGGMIQMQWPLSGAWAIGILVGVRLLFAGLEAITIGRVARSLLKEAQQAGA